MSRLINLQPQSDGLMALYTTEYPDGDRPGGAGTVLLSGSTEHAGSARLYTQHGAYRFGKSTTQHHAELLGQFRSSGSVVAAESAFAVNTFTTETTALRAANVGRMYKGAGAARLTTGYLDETIPASSRNLYFSYHTKFGCDPFRVYSAGVASRTGSLQAGADRSRGERVTIVQSVGGTIEGWVTYDNGSFVSIESDVAATVAGMGGATITGQTSGNSVTTTATVAGVGATKYSRIFHGGIAETTRSIFVPSHANAGTLDFDSVNNGVGNDHFEVDQSGLGGTIVGAWYFIENEFYYSNNAWRVRIKHNGQTWFDEPAAYGLDLGSEIGMRPFLIGLDTPGTSGVGEENVGTSQWIDSLVYQRDIARIVLTDDPIYSDSTKFEVQLHTQWEPNFIDFIFNRGEIASGGWLHIFDSTGSVVDVKEVA